MYRLHGFCQSGNTFKVAFLLRALGQPWEPVFVDFMHGATRAPQWRETANEMGEVPVLDDGARRLTQSGVILTHLARKHGAFEGTGEEHQQEVQRWLFFDNHKFTSYFATYRFMKAFGPTPPDPAVMAWLRARLDNAFGIVDKHLAHQAFMAGASPTIADIWRGAITAVTPLGGDLRIDLSPVGPSAITGPVPVVRIGDIPPVSTPQQGAS